MRQKHESGLQNLQDEHNFEIEIEDNKLGFSIRIDPNRKQIILPITALEYLWACTFYYIVLYQECVKAQSEGCVDFDLERLNDRLRRAEQLFNWAYKNINNNKLEDWPHNLPSPDASLNCDINVANELFLCALAWIIHHEIAHVTLKHNILIHGITINEEKMADIKATEWILDMLQSGDDRLKKRGYGIAIAILTLQSLEVNATNNSHLTHPRPHERLDYCLDPRKYQIGFKKKKYKPSAF